VAGVMHGVARADDALDGAHRDLVTGKSTAEPVDVDVARLTRARFDAKMACGARQGRVPVATQPSPFGRLRIEDRSQPPGR
jgi:hypothetical protein